MKLIPLTIRGPVLTMAKQLAWNPERVPLQQLLAHLPT